MACTGGLAAIFADVIRTAAAETASRMLVGFGAGGAIDVIARMLVEGMKNYAPSFIVDNRPGAGGRLAFGVPKSSPTDGTTMILAPASNFAVYPHVYKTLGYDAFGDFVPVTTVCSFPFLITVGPMVPAEVRTLADFVKWSAANPKQASYGTAAAGSMLHFTGVTLARTGGFEFVHLPVRHHPGAGDYRGATIPTANRCTDRSGGRISGARSQRMVWRFRSGKYACRNGKPPQCGNPHGGEYRQLQNRPG